MFESILQHLAVSIGAVLIVLLSLAVIAAGLLFWFYKARIKKWDAETRAFSLNWLPPRLHLVPDSHEKEKWDRTEKRVQSLAAVGFQQVGRFTASTYDSLKLVGLIHPENGCGAMVYYMEGLGTWSDVFYPALDGEWISASNVKKRLHFLHLPGERKFHEPNKSEAELVDLVLKAHEKVGALPLDQDNFASEFDAAYARRSDARLLEPIEDFELRQLLREMNAATTCGDECSEITGKEFERVQRAFVSLVNKQLASACALDFMRSGSVTASEWKRSRDRLLVVHDRTPLSELVNRKTSEGHVTKELKSLLKSKAHKSRPRERFAKVNASLPLKNRYHKLGTVEQPVTADIYRAPLDGFST